MNDELRTNNKVNVMRKNFLWIMTDQFNANCIGMLGSQVKTPNLDKLYMDSVIFERAYCNNPICAPSRVSFMTGQYVHNHGIQGNRVVEFSERNSDVISTVFRKNGYRTAQIGKSHVPRHWVEEGYECVRMTDLCDAWPNDPSSCHYLDWLEKNGMAGFYEDGTLRPGELGSLDGSSPAALPYKYSNEAYTGNETINYLEETKSDERPFFIKMSFERPHAPMRPAKEYFDMYNPDDIELPESAIDYFENLFSGKPQFMIDQLKYGSEYPWANPDKKTLKKVIAAYYALITCIDMEIGRIITWLKENNLYDSTVIAFNADHGDFAGEHGLFHKNFGIYESIHRIPFIFKIPGIKGNQKRSQIVESVDMYPTFCDIAGLDIPKCVDGISLMPIIEDSNIEGKKEALAEWDWLFPSEIRVNALRTEKYRIVYYNTDIGGELYACEKDPGEIDNLWSDPEYKTIRMELTERLFDRVNKYASRLPIKNDIAANHEERFMPSRLVQFLGMDWDELQEIYKNPMPAKKY